jgi:hypothetical protein
MTNFEDFLILIDFGFLQMCGRNCLSISSKWYLEIPLQGGFFNSLGASISELKIVGKKTVEAESVIWKEL